MEVDKVGKKAIYIYIDLQNLSFHSIWQLLDTNREPLN